MTQEVYERLRSDLITCRLQPGMRLKINDLCEPLGVSKGAVREALSRLSSEGFVVVEPQKGFSVAPISSEDLKHLTEIRSDIEAMCLRRSIELGDVAWESALVAAYHQMSRTPEREEADSDRLTEAFSEVHRHYHEALVAACDNPWLLRIRAMLYAQSERYRLLSLPLAKTRRNTDKEHRAILDAALARDADQAIELIKQHLQRTSQILLDALDKHPPLNAETGSRRKSSKTQPASMD
ncbi:GntR family transcriptional regulator [Pseudomonas sp. NBRC 100443]|nr:GntR family transcriptional regulator [Pseudomonas sp. NBRC 100443]